MEWTIFLTASSGDVSRPRTALITRLRVCWSNRSIVQPRNATKGAVIVKIGIQPLSTLSISSLQLFDGDVEALSAA